MELNICHLYPEVLNLYGDRGNIRCMKKRLEWRGIKAHVDELKIGEHRDLTAYDLFFIGGGQDFEQEVLLGDLKSGKADEIRSAVEDGKTFLCICGGYQMMGHYYETYDGVKCEFLGAVDFYTVGGKPFRQNLPRRRRDAARNGSERKRKQRRRRDRRRAVQKCVRLLFPRADYAEEPAVVRFPVKERAREKIRQGERGACPAAG